MLTSSAVSTLLCSHCKMPQDLTSTEQILSKGIGFSYTLSFSARYKTRPRFPSSSIKSSRVYAATPYALTQPVSH